MERRRRRSRFGAEDDADGADPEPGKVRSEHVRVVFIVGIELEPAQPRNRSLRTKDEPTASSDDVRSGQQPLLRISPRAPQRVPATEVAPYVGALGDVGSDRLVRGTDRPAKNPRHLRPKPPMSSFRPVGEGHHAHTVVRGEGHLRSEAGDQPALLDEEVVPNLAPVDGEADTGKVRVGPVLGREHRLKGLGLKRLEPGSLVSPSNAAT